ncbi:MAG: GAF domain-containing protein [Bacteroidota bacterium]
MKKLYKVFLWIILLLIVCLSILLYSNSAQIAKLDFQNIILKSLIDSNLMFGYLLSAISVMLIIIHLINMMSNKFDIKENFALNKQLTKDQIIDSVVTNNEFVSMSKELEIKLDELKSEAKAMISMAKGEIQDKLLSIIAKKINLVQAEIYLVNNDETRRVRLKTSYAYYNPEGKVLEFEEGEGLVGQVMKNGVPLNLTNVPDGYITVISGLGKTTPQNLLIVPIVSANNNIGVIEMASFSKFEKETENVLTEIAALYGEYMKKNVETINE